jgi:hypothetical protein
VASEVEWEGLSSKQCEDLITALLTELYPHGRRIDGRGGDRGRDFEVPVESGWHRFEVKSWARDFGKSQHQQLRDSLRTTLKANPVKVTIVVPLDQTPPMISWLDRQQATTSVPLEWRGRTWLETHLAARPHLVRAFVRTSLERTLERLAEYHAEQAALPNGMPDAIQRAERLQARTDEIDLHYQFGVETAPGKTIITIIPRTERSQQEHPITVSVNFAFPTGDPHAAEVKASLQQALDYGDAVTVPSEYVADVRATLPGGLGKELGGGAAVALGPTAEIPWDRDGRIILVDAVGRALHQLPVRFTCVAAAQRGFFADVEDVTGALRLRFRGPKGPGQGRVGFRFTAGEHAIPADLLAPLRFLDALRVATTVRLLAGTRRLFDVRVTPVGDIASSGLGLVEALARIQEGTGVFFALPKELTEQQVEAIVVADALLRDREVTAQGGQTTMVVTHQRARQLLEAFPSGQIALWQPNEPFTITVAGHQVPLGPVSIHAACARFDPAALYQWLALRPGGSGDQLVELLLTVDASDGPIIRLVA